MRIISCGLGLVLLLAGCAGTGNIIPLNRFDLGE